jgi:lipopolysaccharide/colanic/teichoic acid biosynthesis glycosyltransferase
MEIKGEGTMDLRDEILPTYEGLTDPGEPIPHPGSRLSQKKIQYLKHKRIFDFFLTVLILMFIWPVFLLIGLLIAMDSRGPVLFSQERAGFDWRNQRRTAFRMYKFRSMRQSANQDSHEKHVREMILAEDQDQSKQKMVKLDHDPRVTRVGKLLRRTSLDELPQLINVLTGEMSLVGPRPFPMYEIGLYQTWHFQRLQATPGITGVWQVEGRGRTTLDEITRMDIDYIQKQSLLLDLKLLFRTLPAVLRGLGAS